MAARAPGLYRLARALRRASVVAVVLVIVYVALAGYSLTRFRPSDVTASSFSSPRLGGSFVTLGGALNLTNPGLLPVNSLSVGAVVMFENGTVLGSTAPAAVAIPAGGTATLPVTVSLPLSASGAAASLLTVDQTLVLRILVNATYATVFTAEVAVESNHSWGAPFSGLNVTPGTPIPGAGNNVTVPLTISFADHAPWADVGTVTIALTRTGAGCPPSSTTVGLNVPPQGTYGQTVQFNTTRSCLAPGQSVSVTYSGPSFSVTLPPRPIT